MLFTKSVPAGVADGETALENSLRGGFLGLVQRIFHMSAGRGLLPTVVSGKSLCNLSDVKNHCCTAGTRREQSEDYICL